MNAENQPPSEPEIPQSSVPSASVSPVSQLKSYHWLWLAIGLVGVAMLSATAGALLAITMASTPLMQRKLTPQEAAVFSKGELSKVNNLQLPDLSRPVNILVLGAKVLSNDVADDSGRVQKLGYHALINSFEGLTDTMLLLRFNPETRKMVILSIPRDTRVEIPGYGIGKINEANANGGPALSAKTVSQLLEGVGIDRYITINVQGVQALVDALGGLTVYVPKDMKYTDESQHLYVNLKAGKQHLNGEQVLQLLRFRHDALGDIGRIQRQQMVFRALSDQALNPATLTRFPQILSVIRSHIDTNLTVEELLALLGFATHIDRSNMQMMIVPGQYGDIATYGTSYWLADSDRIAMMMAQHFNVGTQTATTIVPNQVRVSIQDSTQRSSPQNILQRLQHAGYSNVIVTDPYGEPLTVTRILAQQGDLESAEAVRKVLGFGEVRVEGTGDLNSDVTIQLGQDAVPKQAQTP